MTAIKKFFGRSRKDVDMTTGNIPKHLITFALPLLIGNIFQQFYNMVDSWVVGNYVSDAAYAAVGSVGPIVNLLIGFFLRKLLFHRNFHHVQHTLADFHRFLCAVSLCNYKAHSFDAVFNLNRLLTNAMNHTYLKNAHTTTKYKHHQRKGN